MSRQAAKTSITNKMIRQELERAGVDLLGGGLDEAPMAYKDIREVMSRQEQLVEIIGEFVPRIVRMSGEQDER